MTKRTKKKKRYKLKLSLYLTINNNIYKYENKLKVRYNSLKTFTQSKKKDEIVKSFITPGTRAFNYL